MADQPYVTLNDGRAMPQFGLGVFQTPQDVAAGVVETALKAGYRSIDTAAIYGNERGVGEGLKASGVARDDIFLTTKLWNEHQGYDSALANYDKSLGRLGLETIDLYLIHWPSPSRNLFVDSWKALVRLKQEGRVGSIGVSNFAPEHLERIIGETGVAPVLNQIELHPAFQQKTWRAANASHGVLTESWSPLGRGNQLDDPVLSAIAAKHGKTTAQVIIRWHLDQGLIVIPKSVTPSRIVENIGVFDFKLDADDLAKIDALDRADGRIGPDPVTASF
jgi:2,5-diketo-D-gluconate reductase A